jgi:hypothetical protein
MGPGGILGKLVPNLGAIAPLVLGPHLVIVGEVFDWGLIDGHVLQSTRVTVNMVPPPHHTQVVIERLESKNGQGCLI